MTTQDAGDGSSAGPRLPLPARKRLLRSLTTLFALVKGCWGFICDTTRPNSRDISVIKQEFKVYILFRANSKV